MDRCFAGEYIIGIKFDGIHVPKSPFTVQVDPDCPEAKNLTIQGFRDRGIEVCGTLLSRFLVEFNEYSRILTNF